MHVVYPTSCTLDDAALFCREERSEMASLTFNLLGGEGCRLDNGEETCPAQSRTFLYWVNLHLKRKAIRVSDLYEDLESGVVLIKLMECLAPGKKLPGR